MAFIAAPLPRPPQPIRPIFSVSLPAAWTIRALDSMPASEPAAIVAVPCLRKSRREFELAAESEADLEVDMMAPSSSVENAYATRQAAPFGSSRRSDGPGW